MKILTWTLIGATAWLTVGCANPERSRDLGNPAIAGSVLAQQTCSMCHGVTGVATSPNFPNLAGQTEGYVVAQLTEFRSHSREDPAGFEYMWGIARRLTDAQIGIETALAVLRRNERRVLTVVPEESRQR